MQRKMIRTTRRRIHRRVLLRPLLLSALTGALVLGALPGALARPSGSGQNRAELEEWNISEQRAEYHETEGFESSARPETLYPLRPQLEFDADSEAIARLRARYHETDVVVARDTRFPSRPELTYDSGSEGLASLRAAYHVTDGVEVASLDRGSTDPRVSGTGARVARDGSGSALLTSPSQELWVGTIVALGLILIVGGASVVFIRRSPQAV
jgi:hypothetical protein